jgi:transcriptional regulator with XRE-family HTH domain
MLKEEVRQAIGERLKESRRAGKRTQDEAAALLAVTRQTISAWELGKSLPTAEQWYVIGQVYGVSLDYLVYGIKTVPVSRYGVIAKIFGSDQCDGCSHRMGAPEVYTS